MYPSLIPPASHLSIYLSIIYSSIFHKFIHLSVRSFIRHPLFTGAARRTCWTTFSAGWSSTLTTWRGWWPSAPHCWSRSRRRRSSCFSRSYRGNTAPGPGPGPATLRLWPRPVHCITHAGLASMDLSAGRGFKNRLY